MKIDKEILDHLNSHDKPKTRRDFLSLGLTSFCAASMFNPSQLLANTLFENIGNRTDLPAFLVFDLAGGAALVGNFLVGGKGGATDLISSYSMLGWNPRTVTLDQRFGLPMAPQNISKMLEGIVQTASEDALKKLRFGSLLHAASSDSSRNPLSAVGLVAKAGKSGELFSKSLSHQNSTSGGRSRCVLNKLEYKPISFNTPEALNSLVGLGPHLTNLKQMNKESFLNHMRELVLSFSQHLTGDNLEKYLKQTDEAYDTFQSRVTGAGFNLDARADATAREIYGIAANTNPRDKNVVFASIVNAAIKNLSGGGVLTFGGCDYHNGTSTLGDRIDLEIGQNIGRAVEMAHRNEKPLFIQILTDGGIYSRSNSRVWLGDSDDRCMTVIGYYNPKEAPRYKKENKFQVGHYTNGQGVERSTLIGNSPALSTYSVFANYLQVSGQIERFRELAPGIFDNKQLEEVLIFEG